MTVTITTTTSPISTTPPPLIRRSPLSPSSASSPIHSANNTFRPRSNSIKDHMLHQHHNNNNAVKERHEALTVTCPRPIPNSYWATPLLLACEYPWCPSSAHKLDCLLLAGVRTFIDLTESGELSPYHSILNSRASALGIHVEDLNEEEQIEYHRFPIRDRSLPRSISQIHSIMRVLYSAQQRNRISAVHCRGGIGRTGLVVGCWLVSCGLASDGEEALSIIAKEWKGVEKCTRFPHSPETGDQEKFVRNWDWKWGSGECGGIMGLGSGLSVTGGVKPFLKTNKSVGNAQEACC